MKSESTMKLILIFTVILSSAIALEITSPEDPASTVFLSPRIWWIGPAVWDFDLAGELVSINSSDVANKIVLSRNYDNSEIEDLWRRNALGAVLYSGNSPLDIPGITNYMLEHPQHDVLLPTVTISIYTFDQLRTWIEDEGRNITIRISSRDPNPWDEMMQSGVMIFFSVFMSVFTLFCIGLAAYKLAMFVKAKGCHQSIPQTMLIFEIIANTIRFFACVVDPLQSRGLLPYALYQVLLSVHWPFALMNILLISLYWHELMNKTSMNVITFLDKLRVPFWCIFAIILGLEFLAGMLRGFGLAIHVFRNPFVVLAVCYMLIGLACVIFYIYTGTKLTQTMRRSSAELMASRKVKRLNRTSKFIFASSAGVICWLIVIAIGGLTDTLWVPWGYFGVWFAQFFLTTFISLTQQLAIQEPNSICARTKDSKSSNGSRTSNRFSTKPTQLSSLQNQSEVNLMNSSEPPSP